jgi:hypothetical protein
MCAGSQKDRSNFECFCHKVVANVRWDKYV